MSRALFIVLMVSGCTVVSDFDGYTFERSTVRMDGTAGAAGSEWVEDGAAGGAGSSFGEAGVGGAAGSVWPLDSGEPLDQGDAETPLQDAQQPVPDAGAPEDAGAVPGLDAGVDAGADAAVDAGTVLGTQCELCGGDFGACAEGFSCTELDDDDRYCLAETTGSYECALGLYAWPELYNLRTKFCKPTSGSCAQWLQVYGP